LVGPLSPKDKTQLEERLRRVPGPSTQNKVDAVAIPAPASGVSRLANTGITRPASPSVAAVSRIGRSASPAFSNVRSASPAPSLARSESPSRPTSASTHASVAPPTSPGKSIKPRSMLPSRLGRPRTTVTPVLTSAPTREQAPYDSAPSILEEVPPPDENIPLPTSSSLNFPSRGDSNVRHDLPDDITLTISSILSSDPSRSVDALKKIQKILSVGPDNGPSSPQYRELAEHTEGLIETITLQMAHVFEHPSDLVSDDNFRLAKHLIQTLNNFCDHSFLAESLTVDILTSLLDELTLRLLETDDSSVKKVKDLSRFINMIILRLFATGRRMSIFRYVKPILSLDFPHPFLSVRFLHCSFKSSNRSRVMASFLTQKKLKWQSWFLSVSGNWPETSRRI